ncbi:MAG: transglycosylase domain-containing protein [Woeseiaceae bacterium]|nr:transglycosylase domain-containing protein [Woeseiaceae bacterium]
MRKAAIRLLSVLAVVSFVILLAVPQYLYLKGLRGVPADRDPLDEVTIPKTVSQSYWRYLGGQGKPYTEPKNPYEFLFDFFVLAMNEDTHHRPTAEYSLLSQAARSVMFREKPSANWHLSNASALIWISRNWSVDKSISTVLADQYFGHGFRGIGAAAHGYFGTSLEDLSEAETVYLLVMSISPTWLSPWCYPERHRDLFKATSERIGLKVGYNSIELLPVPSGACE